MAAIVIQALKYVITVLFVTYICSAFLIFQEGKKPEKQKKIFRAQRFFIFTIHGLGFLCLYLKQPDIELVGFYLMQIILFALIDMCYHFLYKRCSILLLNHMLMLLAISMIILTRLSFAKAFRQFVFLAAGSVAMLLIPLFIQKGSLFRRFSVLYFMAGVSLLAYVVVMGSVSYGAKLNITIAGFSFQPSEFVKIIFVFFIAAMLYQNTSGKRLFLTSGLSAIFVLLLVASKDLGGALLYFMAYLVIIYVASKKLLYFLAGIIGMGGAAVAGYFVFSHVRTRVDVWLNPTADIDNKGYQICQSLFGIGTGGWFGLGIGEGLPNKIPVVDKDFIFSAISEEFGGIFAIGLILLCLSCFFVIMKVAMEMVDSFYKYVAIGLGTLYATQVILTIGGAIKFIPSTGVTLPLVSYGGSSLLSTLVVFGIIQGLFIRNRIAQEELEAEEEKEKEEAAKDKKGKVKKIKKKQPSNKEAYVVNYLFLAVFLAMAAYMVQFLTFQSENFINNEYNGRAALFEKEVVKGEILTSDGYVIAETLVDLAGNESRFYPYGELFSHVTGYTGNVKTGLERQLNFSLLRSHSNLWEQFVCEFTEEKKIGDNVVSSIRYDLQEAAFEALGEYEGAVIVMEPSTGKILAMVSKPGFDPNTIEEDWEKLQDSTSLYNRASQGQYAPGSIFKVFTTLAYMESNPETYSAYTYECTGEIRLGNKTIHCASNKAHGEVDLNTSFAESCNTSYANMMAEIDEEVFQKLCNYTLFNQELPFTMESSKSKFSIKESDTEALKIETSIGQGETLVSPLHMVMMASAICNDGLVMRPTLIERVENYTGSLVKETQPQEYKTLFTETQVAALSEYMRSTVEFGTAEALQSEDYTVYGKTGTAQTTSDLEKTNAWFVGYAAAGEKELAIAVVVENSGNGSVYGVPVAKKVMDIYFMP